MPGRNLSTILGHGKSCHALPWIIIVQSIREFEKSADLLLRIPESNVPGNWRNMQEMGEISESHLVDVRPREAGIAAVSPAFISLLRVRVLR
jgi:hypothetical protein